MQKQILDFDTIIAPRPTDLFLISHAGKTCNVALNTVVAYANAQILPFVSYLNGVVSTLSALEHVDVVYLSSNVLALSADRDVFNSRVNQVSADIQSLSSGLISSANYNIQVGSNIIALSSNISLLSASVDQIIANTPGILTDFSVWSAGIDTTISNIQASVSAVSSFYLKLTAGLVSLGSNFTEVSALTQYLSASFNTIDLAPLDTRIQALSSLSYYLSASIDSLISSVSSSVETLSSAIISTETNFNTLLSGLSSNFYTDLNSVSSITDNRLSSLEVFSHILSSYTDSIDAFYQTASGIITGDVQFDGHTIKSFDTITIRPSSQFIVNTFNQSGSRSHEWTFDQDGLLTMAGGVRYATNIEDGGPYNSPEVLDLSKPVQKLNSGVYRLLDGVEGQIMYFVPKNNTAGDLFVEVHITNARYWVMDSQGRKFAVSSQFYWTPWVLSNHRLDPVYDIFPSIATAIFTDGAWNISTGGRNW